MAEVSPVPLRKSVSFSSQPPTPSTPPGKVVDEEALFLNPSDLTCPITCSVFNDPVLTASGHVYERAAIEQHLRHNQSDPLTRTPLVNKSLTPVFVLKSRAAEYRDGTARLCLERACSPRCPDPVRYLRRAVELVADAGGRDLGVRGLSQETIEYVVSHPSNAYDRLALQVFAQGLFQAGYRDRAAAVYYHLLISGSDRTQQAQLLKRCLACWTQDGRRRQQQLLLLSPGNSSGGGGAAAPGSPTGSRPGSAGSSGGEAAAVGAGGGSGRSGAPGTADADLLVDPLAAADPHVFEKLVLLFEGQAALGWGQIIDMAGEAGLGQEFVARLCEQLLFRPVSLRGGEEAILHPQSWAQEKEILLKYVRVLCQGVREHCSETQRRLEELEGCQLGTPRSGGGGGHLVGPGSASGRARRGAAGGGGPQGRASPGALCRPAWLGHPGFVVACLLASLLSDPGSLVGRVAGATPLLALLPPAQ